MKKKRRKSRAVKILEYLFARALISACGIIPLPVIRLISAILGDLLFFLSKKRRTIAIENLRHALGNEKRGDEITDIARQSCRSFFFTFMEIIKLRRLFSTPETLSALRSSSIEIDRLFRKAKEAHDSSGGCIFVTPHIGNWEVLPHVSASVGIPLVVVARPLDNEYLEKVVFAGRSSSGQVIIPKKNALFVLQKTLQQGKSIGLLPDQSTMKGIPVRFFGRVAYTTPVPALLATTYKRPIVVVACCRKRGDYQYEGFVSDPIMPGDYTSEKDEIIRITEEMTREMEKIIRRYPEQYLWIHNRWKSYKGKKSVFSGREAS